MAVSKRKENSVIDLNISGLILYNYWIIFFMKARKLGHMRTAMLPHHEYGPPALSGG